MGMRYSEKYKTWEFLFCFPSIASIEIPKEFLSEVTKKYDRDTLTAVNLWKGNVSVLIGLVFKKEIDDKELLELAKRYGGGEIEIQGDNYIMELTALSDYSILGNTLTFLGLEE